MTKIITCSELRYRTLAELEALFRTVQIELGRTAPGSPERVIALASLESVRRAMAARLVSVSMKLSGGGNGLGASSRSTFLTSQLRASRAALSSWADMSAVSFGASGEPVGSGSCLRPPVDPG
jgi:hypothetical protein